MRGDSRHAPSVASIGAVATPLDEVRKLEELGLLDRVAVPI